MTAVFVDTNVLLYSVDDRDAGQARRARRLAARAAGRAAAAASQRAGAQRVLRQRAPQVPDRRSPPATRAPWCAATSTGSRGRSTTPTVETAWAVESRYGFSYWDALIVAAAQQQGCRYLLSEDLQHGQQVDSVQILNPFLVGPEILDGDSPALDRPGASRP